MDTIESQLVVRNKCEQLQKSIKELYDWEEQMKTTNTAKGQPADNSENKTLPPVRSDVRAMSKFSEDKASVEKQDQAESETVNKKMLADAEMLKERGNKQCKLGNFPEAIELYSQAIQTYGDNPAYYCNRALCFMNLDLFNDCLMDCSIAIAKDPKYIKAYYRRMQAYERLGESEKAATECRQILRLSHDENELNTAKRDLARIEKRLEGSKKSPSSPGKSVELDPTLALVKQEADKYKELGNKHLARKDFEKAERSYTKAISLFAEEAIYYTNRSLCYWNLKDYDKCLSDCNKAIQLDETYFRPYYRRMQVRELRGAYQSAVEDCRKFIELAKDDKQKGTAEKDLLRLERLVKAEQPAKQAFVWSEIKKNAKPIKFVQKPPHLRSKKPLTRIAIKDLTPCPVVVGGKNLAPSTKYKTIPDAAIDKIFNNNTGERLIEPEEPTNLEHLFPANSKKLRNLFSPPTTPTEQKKPFAVSNKATGTVPKQEQTVTTPGTPEKKDVSAKKVEPAPKSSQKKIDTVNQVTNEKHLKTTNAAHLPVITQPMRPSTVPAIPKTSAQFYTTWSGLDEDLRYQYLKLLSNTTSWRKMLGASLSNEMLSELLHILQKRFIPDQGESVY
uniref:TPR_REGION domain-containing protein n=1 Tax=Anopheles minimus TaxID=112268 RepID=A0A182WM68_9DIPT